MELDPSENRHFDHGYAVTSHSAQGLTSKVFFTRVFLNDETRSRARIMGVAPSPLDYALFASK